MTWLGTAFNHTGITRWHGHLQHCTGGGVGRQRQRLTRKNLDRLAQAVVSLAVESRTDFGLGYTFCFNATVVMGCAPSAHRSGATLDNSMQILRLKTPSPVQVPVENNRWRASCRHCVNNVTSRLLALCSDSCPRTCEIQLECPPEHLEMWSRAPDHNVRKISSAPCPMANLLGRTEVH